MAASAPRNAFVTLTGDAGFGAWAYLVVNEDKTLTRRCECMKYDRGNQIVGLTGLKCLLLETEGDLIINFKGNFLEKYFIEGYPRWLQNGFRDHRGKIIANVELVKSIGELMKGRSITFNKIEDAEWQIYFREVSIDAWHVRIKGMFHSEDKK